MADKYADWRRSENVEDRRWVDDELGQFLNKLDLRDAAERRGSNQTPEQAIRRTGKFRDRNFDPKTYEPSK